MPHSTAAPRYSLIGQSPFSPNSKVPPDRAPVALAPFAESDLRKVPVLIKDNFQYFTFKSSG